MKNVLSTLRGENCYIARTLLCLYLIIPKLIMMISVSVNFQNLKKKLIWNIIRDEIHYNSDDIERHF